MFRAESIHISSQLEAVMNELGFFPNHLGFGGFFPLGKKGNLHRKWEHLHRKWEQVEEAASPKSVPQVSGPGHAVI